jgi:hypothetical protein
MLASATDTTVPATANPLVRQIESEFPGIFLLTPKKVQSGPNEQFGVWFPGATHVGDIMSDGEFFTAEELRSKVFTSIREFRKATRRQ